MSGSLDRDRDTRGDHAELGPAHEYGVFIAGSWVPPETVLPVTDKYTGAEIGHVGHASPDLVDRAVGAASHAASNVPFPPEERHRVLAEAARLLERMGPKAVEVHTAETGFTLADSERDWRRAVQTLQISAEESKRVAGEMVPLDWPPGGAGRMAFTMHSPVGVVCAITPFNSPLNTVLHKVAPALAAGNAVVLKPAVPTPLSAARLCDLFAEAGLPAGYLNVVFGGAEVGNLLLEDARIGFYAFTGSTEVGRHIIQTVGLRRAQLELGNISATIVCEDADVPQAVKKIKTAAFRKAGQVCTSVQRLLVHRDRMGGLQELLTLEAEGMTCGDPWAAETDIGPMIHEREAQRALEWVEEAIAGGATALAGASRKGALMTPTVLTDVQSEMRVLRSEIFAPVVSVVPFETIDEAIDTVNATPFGLAAGIFTGSLDNARAAMQRLRVGVVQINDTSSNRMDSMPYGGVKESGFGKEGPRNAIREMSDERLVVIN